MSEDFTKKNIKLISEFDEYIARHPKVYAAIPNGAWIVITVKNDKKFNDTSISLVRDRRRKKVVEAHKSGTSWTIRPLQLQA